MPLTIDDALSTITTSEVEAEILSLCNTFQLPVTSWQSGSVVRTVIAVLSQAFSTKTAMYNEIGKGGFGDLASPEWCKIFAKAVYDIDFNPALPATGLVTFTNTSANAYPVNPGDLIIAHGLSGKTYRNTVSLTIPPSGSISDIVISADEVGTASNAAPGEIDVVVTSLAGVSVTNPAAVLGSDEETPAALIQRCKDKLASLSPDGAKGAYDYVVKTPSFTPGISSFITRSKTIADALTGVVGVYVANATGAPPSPDLAILQDAIDRNAEPWCVSAVVFPASPVSVDITSTVYLKSSLTIAQIQSYVAQAISVYLSTVPIGGVVIPPSSGKIYLEKLEFIIHTSVPGVERVQVTVPSGDLSMTDDAVAVVGTITTSVVYL